eukprot:1876224-Alexandrium_andersonii.AAC.1
MVMVVVMASPKQAQNRPPERSRSPFSAAVRAERAYGNENLPGAHSGLVPDGFRPRLRVQQN